MRKIRIEYLAGIVDGEGCLSISRFKKDVEYKRGFRFNPIFSIANIHIPLLTSIQRQFGGRIRIETGGVYAIYFKANEIRTILPRLSKHLIVKRDQAEVLLAFLQKTKANGPRPISDKDFKFYESCFWKLRDMKKVRYTHDWSPVAVRDQKCGCCEKLFQVYSNHPHKKYCSDYCKRKVHWTRSNARISAGLPAWAGLSHGGVPQEHIEHREN